MSGQLQALIARLDGGSRQALERAAQRCHRGGHRALEIEHLLRELAEDASGLPGLLTHFGIETEALRTQLDQALLLYPGGFGQNGAFSAQTAAWLEAAAVLADEFKHEKINAAVLLLALLDNPQHCVLLIGSVPLLLRIERQALRRLLPELPPPDGAGPEEEALFVPEPLAASPSVLERYTQDLTEEARAGRIDPIVGRDDEIRQIVDVLLRRRQNNPILVGEPGVGKTALAEGLALRIAAGEVPPPLRDVSLRLLDLGLLQAGAGIKGEFEQRLKSVIDTVVRSECPVVLFIDEAHTLIGAGAAEGHGDAANLLKPALARGELRTIAATTWREYKQYFEKDPALARRFQLIKVEEPDEARAIDMLRAVATRLEAHHGVDILDAAIVDAVRLSHRYLSGRLLPDKAISLLDTACARVALAQHDIPPPLQQLRHRLRAQGEERDRLQREQIAGGNHAERLAGLDNDIATIAVECDRLETRWQEERQAVQALLDTRRRLLALDADSTSLERDAELERLAIDQQRLEAGLDALRQDDPLVPEQVDPKTVAAVVADWTGIPVGHVQIDEDYAIRTLAQRMGQRILGQDEALRTLARRIQAWRYGLTDPAKPVGVFLLLGPTGVGKTETAYALADALYGGERNLIGINLSEYQEAHTVSQLKGAPPGYVGYGTGGVLTEAVRRRPYSVVLLDEIEKAHPDVLEAFYNVFDKGVMEDGTGLVVDFRNTVILATSNAGAEVILETPSNRMGADTFNELLRKVLLQTFRQAFLARMTVVHYRPLEETTLEDIVNAKLETLWKRYEAATGKPFEFDPGIVKAVLARCSSGGARNVEDLLMSQIMGKITE